MDSIGGDWRPAALHTLEEHGRQVLATPRARMLIANAWSNLNPVDSEGHRLVAPSRPPRAPKAAPRRIRPTVPTETGPAGPEGAENQHPLETDVDDLGALADRPTEPAIAIGTDSPTAAGDRAGLMKPGRPPQSPRARATTTP